MKNPVFLVVQTLILSLLLVAARAGATDAEVGQFAKVPLDPSFVAGAEFNSDNRNYTLLENLKAWDSALKNAGEPPAQSLLVEQRGSLRIFYISADETSTQTERIVFPVVHNNSTGVLGMITGSIHLVYKDGYQTTDFASEYQLRQGFHRPKSGLLTLEVPIPIDVDRLLAAYRRLQRDGRIERVDLGVIEHLDGLP